MPGKKYSSNRYYKYFEMLQGLVNYETNSLFKSIMTGKDIIVPYGGANLSLNILIGDIVDKINEIKPIEKEKIVNGKTVTEIKYNEELNERRENELNTYRQQFNKVFDEYKQAHPNAEDEAYMEEYKKFEYIQDVFKLYDAQQKDFEIYSKAQGQDYPADADLTYDNTADVKDINEYVAIYKKEQGELYGLMNTLDSFVDSANFDPEILSEELKADLGDKDITSQNLITGNFMARFNNSINVALEKNNKDVAELKQDTERRIDEKLNALRFDIVKLREEENKQVQEAQKSFNLEVGERQGIVNDLNAQLRDLQADHSATNLVIDKLNVCREMNSQVSNEYRIRENELTELSDDQAEEHIQANNNKLTALDQDNANIDKQIQDIRQEIQQRENSLTLANQLYDGFFDDPETVKLADEIEKAASLADKADALLIKANKRGGINNLSSEDLESIGLKVPAQHAVYSNKATDDAVKAIYKVVGNDKMTVRPFNTDTQLSRDLGESVKYLDNFFNGGKLNSLLEQYNAENGTNLKIDFDPALKKQFVTMEHLAGPDKRGQIYTAEDAMEVYELYRVTGRLNTFAEKNLQDPFFEQARAELTKASKAIEAVVARPELAGQFAQIAANVTEFGTQAQRADKLKKSIKDISDTNRQLASDKQMEKDLKQFQLLDNINTIDKENMDAEEQIETLNQKKEQNNLNKDYLKASNEVFTAVKGINAHKREVSELQETVKEAESRTTSARKKIEAKTQEIQTKTQRDIDEKNAQYNKAKSRIKQEANIKYNNLMLDKENLTSLSHHVGNLQSKIGGMQSTVRIIQNKQQALDEKQVKALGRLNMSKKAVMDEMNKSEVDLVNRMLGTKKFFSDSGKFTDMKTALQNYVSACANDNNKNLTAEQFRSKVDAARTAIKAYVAKRDDNKWTESGQIRLDTAKNLLQMFDQKEQMLNIYAQEEQKITNKNVQIDKIKVASEAEELIVKQADEDKQLKNYDKEFRAPSQKRFAEGLDKIKQVFKPLRESVADKSDYLAEKIDKGINALAKGNIKLFTEAVAAVITCKDVEAQGRLAAFNNNSAAFDLLHKRYTKAPEVQNMAKQLVTQEVSPKEFLESLSPDKINNIKQKATEHEVKTAHKIEDLNIKGL